MPDKDVPDLHLQTVYTGPDGDLSLHETTFKVSAAEGSGDLAANDRFFLAPLPSGMRIYDIIAVVTDASNASVTMRVGTHQKGAGAWVDDDDYFLGDAALSAVAEFSSRAVKHHKPLTIDEKNVYLTGRIDGADISEATEISFQILYRYVGNL